MQHILDTVVQLVKENVSASIPDSTIGLFVGLIISLFHAAVYDFSKYLFRKFTGKIVKDKSSILPLVAILIFVIIIIGSFVELEHFIHGYIKYRYISVGLSIWIVWGIIVAAFQLFLNNLYVAGEPQREKYNNFVIIIWGLISGCTLGIPVSTVLILHGIMGMFAACLIGILVLTLLVIACSYLSKKMLK